MSATLPPKLYFRIGEVSGLVGVEPHVLRYWEREFARTIRPAKSAKGQRVYSRRDVENLLKVRDLLYTEGFTIAGARKQLRVGGRAGSSEAASATNDAEETATSAAPSAEEQAVANAVSPSQPAPESHPDGRRAPVLGQLRELRDELQAFLAELGG